MFKRFQNKKKWIGSLFTWTLTQKFWSAYQLFFTQDKEDFDVNFVGKVIGIGATIQESKGKIKSEHW